MTKKRKKILIGYGVVILIILIAIMFIIPDSAFLKLYNKNIKKIENQEVAKKEFIDYDTQKERILNKQFKYEYLLLDSLSNKTYKYNCNGTLDKDIESGTCTEPERLSYTEQTKRETFKINVDYLDIAYILNLVKDITPEEIKYQTTREYTYKTTLDKLDTEILIYTDLENITKVEISNKYMTYILKYSDISY
jgi:hypothetical protein